jgi:hypothetical protein
MRARLLTALASLTLLFGLGGCAPVNREELAKEVLKADPDFRYVLDKQRQMSNRIQTYQQELALKRSTVDRTIKQLRRDLAESVTAANKKIAQAKGYMAPDHERLTFALSMAGEELKMKRLNRASLGRSIAQLQKALKSEHGASGLERAHQEAQLNEMLADAKRLDQELETLHQHVRLLKVKLLLIKF